jgi:hypothetical protein
LSVTIDTAAPAAPTVAPDLDSLSDSGVSSTDNITRITTPTFTGAVDLGILVRLFANSTEVASDLEPDGIFYGLTTSPLTDGVKGMQTKFEDLAGNLSAASPTLNVTIDTLAPALSGSPAFNFATAPHSLTFVFNENVGPTLASADFTVLREPSTSIVTAVAFNTSTRTATITFPVNGTLSEGRYRSTLAAAGVTDIAGNPLAADNLFNFLFMIADANNDGIVNLTDFNRLASNFGQSGRNFTQGDFNYDGLVNLADFNLLASRFGTSVAPAAARNDLLGGLFNGATDHDPSTL